VEEPFHIGHIMVFGVHAGGAEVMADAAVLRHTRAGHRATLVHMTPGEKGRPALPAEEYTSQKREEAAATAKALRAEAVMLGYDALGTVRGALAGRKKAVAFMLPRGVRTRRWEYFPEHGPLDKGHDM